MTVKDWPVGFRFRYNSPYTKHNKYDRVVVRVGTDPVSDKITPEFYLKNKSEIVACKNLGEFEPSLKVDIFFRIHQSYIVNMEKVVCVHKRNGYYCEMSNGARLPIAKRRIEDFNKYLKIKQ